MEVSSKVLWGFQDRHSERMKQAVEASSTVLLGGFESTRLREQRLANECWSGGWKTNIFLILNFGRANIFQLWKFQYNIVNSKWATVGTPLAASPSPFVPASTVAIVAHHSWQVGLVDVQHWQQSADERQSLFEMGKYRYCTVSATSAG